MVEDLRAQLRWFCSQPSRAKDPESAEQEAPAKTNVMKQWQQERQPCAPTSYYMPMTPGCPRLLPRPPDRHGSRPHTARQPSPPADLSIRSQTARQTWDVIGATYATPNSKRIATFRQGCLVYVGGGSI